MRRQSKICVVILAIVLSLLKPCFNSDAVALNAQTNQEQSFVVGAIFPLTGEYEDIGKVAKAGLEIGAEQIANGSGVSIQLRICDNRGLEEETRECLYNLIQEGVDFIIGPMLTETALVAKEIVNHKRVVTISLTASDPSVTDQRDGFMFSMVSPDHLNGQLLSDWILGEKKVKSFGTVPVTVGYGRGLELGFTYDMNRRGVRQIARLSKDERVEGGPPLNKYLCRLKSADVILVPLRGYHAGSTVAYLRNDLKYKGILIGGDGWDTGSFAVGANCPGDCSANESHFFTFFTDQATEVQENPIYTIFAAEYTSRTGLSPGEDAVLSYDAIGLLMKTIEKGMDPSELANRMRNTNNYAGSIGRIDFGGREYPTLPLFLSKYEDGKPVYQRRLMQTLQSFLQSPLQGTSNSYSDVYLLFAHGFQSEPSDFDSFVEYAKGIGVPESQIFRTQVSKDDYASVRAKQLASYINQNQIPDRSLIVVTHSMGGLDMRWMIGNAGSKVEDQNGQLDRAARKVKAVYTIATPHGGTYSAASAACYWHACYDLSINHNFNNRKEVSYQYMHSMDGCHIPFTSLAFWAGKQPSCAQGSVNVRCTWEESFVQNGQETDGLVLGDSQKFQSLIGASPPIWGEYQGCHCDGYTYTWELKQTDKLQKIIDDAMGRSACSW